MEVLGKIQPHQAPNFGSEPREVVLEKHILPVRWASCKKYGKIYFCLNATKNSGVFKYVYLNDTLHRVQCGCCSAEDSTVVGPDDVFLRNPENVVDDESRNFLNYQLQNSHFCPDSGKLLIRATHNNDEQLEVLFDPLTEKFSLHRKFYPHRFDFIMENSFEHGAQGLKFAKHHRDAHGNPLLCLAFTSHHDFHHTIEYFCDMNGRIGKYYYNECFQFYQLETRLNVRVQPFERTVHKKLRYDDELLVWYQEYCPKLKTSLIFASYMDDTTKTYQFHYNRAYLQFELVECSSLVFDEEKKNDNMNRQFLIALLPELFNLRPIIFLRKMDGTLVKAEKEKPDGHFVYMERAPIRIFDTSYEEYLRRKENLGTMIHHRLFKLYDAEKYVIHNVLGKQHCFLITLDGHIQRYTFATTLGELEANFRLAEGCQPLPKLPVMRIPLTHFPVSPKLVKTEPKKEKKYDADDFDISMISEAVEELHVSTEKSLKSKMNESTTTALEPSDDEDVSDTESTATAIDFTPSERAIQFYREVNSIKKASAIEDDQESTATAQEPSELSDASFLEDDLSDTESTATAVDFTPSERAILFYKEVNKKNTDDDQESTATAIEPCEDDDDEISNASVVDGDENQEDVQVEQGASQGCIIS